LSYRILSWPTTQNFHVKKSTYQSQFINLSITWLPIFFKVCDKKPSLRPETKFLVDSGNGNEDRKLPPVKLTLKLDKTGPARSAQVPPIDVGMTSRDLLSACASIEVAPDADISTSMSESAVSGQVEPPKPPESVLSMDELSPATSSVYIHNAQVRRIFAFWAIVYFLFEN
jgi:hypothetical protein